MIKPINLSKKLDRCLSHINPSLGRGDDQMKLFSELASGLYWRFNMCLFAHLSCHLTKNLELMDE